MRSESGYVTQPSIHAAVLTALVQKLRSDTFGSPASKVVLVGHSLGSLYSSVVLHTNPELVDGAVLTGIAFNVSNMRSSVIQQPRLASLQNPLKWGHLDGGWTTWVDVYGLIQG